MVRSVAFLFGAAIACAAAPAAAVVVDGNLDPTYGAAKSHVGYDPGAPDSNFGNPTNVSKYTSYDIYGVIDGDTLYGFFQATPTQPGEAAAGAFVNLYLDTNPGTSPGSDLGFEVTNDRAFVPGENGYSSPLGLSFYAQGNVVEFGIPLELLRNGVPGLPDFTQFVQPGGRFTFRLSQSFGYSVAGGPSYGDDRLGAFTMPAGAVPEPASWALMLGGFGLAGAALRRRARLATLVTA